MKIKVNWYDERAFDDDDNGGYVYGIYWMDSEEVTHVEWYASEAQRNDVFEVKE